MENIRFEKVAETVEQRGNILANMAPMLVNDVRAFDGELTPESQDKAMYKTKIRRLVEKTCKKKIEEKKGRLLEGFMFDEHKDNVKKQVKNGNKYILIKKKEENCTVVIFPGEKRTKAKQSK